MDSKRGDWKQDKDKEFTPDQNYQFQPKIPITYYFPKEEGNNYNQKFNQEMNSEYYNRPHQSEIPYVQYTPQTQPQFNTNNYRVNQVNWSNINNMNINIINQIPMTGPGQSYINEDFTDQFNNINLFDNRQGTKKDTYYNYYFGNPPDEREKYSSQKNYFNKFKDNYDMPNYEQQMNYVQPNKMPNYNSMNENYQNAGFRISNYGNMETPERKYNQNRKQFNKGYSQMNNHEISKLFILIQIDNNLNRERMMFRSNDNILGRFFVMKSVDEDNVHKSIKYRIWCSTPKGNQKLHKVFKEADNKYPIYLFFSVNGSGRFLGLAQMTSEVENKANFNFWSQNEKWKGFFFVVWLTIKDVPNKAFRHIINEYNENKPVTSSRDTQEIHPIAGAEMLKIFSKAPYETSILDDFKFYEQKQDSSLSKRKNSLNEDEKRVPMNQMMNSSNISNSDCQLDNSSIINNLNPNSRDFVPMNKMFKKVSSENQLSRIGNSEENEEEI